MNKKILIIIVIIMIILTGALYIYDKYNSTPPVTVAPSKRL